MAENARRGTGAPEYELLDTGIFAEDRYFDVFVEYAQGEPGDLLMQITAWNRGPEAACLHMIPQLVMRNTWSWEPGTIKPLLRAVGDSAIGIEPAALGMSFLYVDGGAELLFTENESNTERLWGIGGSGYFKDGFHERIVGSREARVNPGGATRPERRAREPSERTSTASAAKSSPITWAARWRGLSGDRCEARRPLCASEKATDGRDSAMRE